MTQPGRLAADTCDVAVAGGGPAGCAVACRLAALGYDVVLVAAGRAAPDDRMETLPPSISALDGPLPLSRALAHAKAANWARLSWISSSVEISRDPGTLLIRRSTFDAALLDAARDAGARVIAPARVRQPVRQRAGWSVPLGTASGARTLSARFLVHATGRIPRSEAERCAPATVALSSRWVGAAVEPGTVMVEALPDAWCWSVAGTDDTVEVAAFVEMNSCAGRRRRALLERLEQLVGTSRLLGAAAGGRCAGPLRVRDATSCAARRAAWFDAICVGDAAFAPDPLSSQGVQCALRSGLQAGAVVHTILSGGDSEAAIEFHETGVRRLASSHRKAAADHYARHQTWRYAPFWASRAAPSLLAPMPVASPETAVAPDTMICLASTAVIASHPAISGDLIRRVPTVAAAPYEAPLAWYGAVALPTLVAHLHSARRASDILANWSSVLPLDHAQHLLNTLLARRILVAH